MFSCGTLESFSWSYSNHYSNTCIGLLFQDSCSLCCCCWIYISSLKNECGSPTSTFFQCGLDGQLSMMVTGHFGHKTLRTHTRHFGTGVPYPLLKAFRRSFSYILGTEVSNSLMPKCPDTRHQFCGAEVSWCRNVLWPKCPAPRLLYKRPLHIAQSSNKPTAYCTVQVSYRPAVHAPTSKQVSKQVY